MPPYNSKKLQFKIDGQVYTYSELRILAFLAEAKGAVLQSVIRKQVNVSHGIVSEKSRALARKGFVRWSSSSGAVECIDKPRARELLAKVDFSEVEAEIAGRGWLRSERAKQPARERKSASARLLFSPEEIDVLLLLIEAERPLVGRDIGRLTSVKALKVLPRLVDRELVCIVLQAGKEHYKCEDKNKVGEILRRLGVPRIR